MTQQQSLRVSSPLGRWLISASCGLTVAIAAVWFHHSLWIAMIGLLMGTVAWRLWERQIKQTKQWNREVTSLQKQLDAAQNQFATQAQTMAALQGQVISSVKPYQITISNLEEKLRTVTEAYKVKVSQIEQEKNSLTRRIDELNDFLNSVGKENQDHLSAKRELSEQNFALKSENNQLKIENDQL